MNAPTQKQRDRLETQLTAAVEVKPLLALAREFQAEGVEQAPLYRLFDEYRLIAEEDGEDAACEVLDEVLDAIAGWGDPAQRLFPTELEG